MAPSNKTVDVADLDGSAGGSATPIVPDSVGGPPSDPSIRGLGFDTPAKDPDAVPIAIRRPAPEPQTAPAIAGFGDGPASTSGTSPFGPTPPNTSRLFQSDSSKPTPPMPPGKLASTSPKPNGSAGKWWLWLLGLIIILAGVYLAADDGLIRGGSHLPCHIFSKYKATATPVSSTSTTTPVPTGFSNYQLTTAGIQFDAPTAWGTPSFTTDPGFSKRGGGNTTDGTHAYLVNFATNKNVQLAFTSGKFLPASRTDNRYFDNLQWCTGSLDQKLYQQTLLFTTTAGVDTPATVVCSQGPIANATQLDNATILITKVKATDGTTLGDDYIKNLSGNVNTVVMRALDMAMTNGTDIKTLLGTVQNL